MTVASTSVCGSEAAPPGLLFVVKALKWSVCLNFKTIPHRFYVWGDYLYCYVYHSDSKV